jgi:hypothetical protein
MSARAAAAAANAEKKAAAVAAAAKEAAIAALAAEKAREIKAKIDSVAGLHVSKKCILARAPLVFMRLQRKLSGRRLHLKR